MNRKTTEKSQSNASSGEEQVLETVKDPVTETKRQVEADAASGAPLLQQELNALKQDVSQIRKDLAELSSAIRALAADKVESSRATVAENARKGKDELQKQLEQALSAGRKSVSDLESRIDQQPIASVLTAAAVGYVVARLLGHSGSSGKVETGEEAS